MNRIRFIGDIHGKNLPYVNIVLSSRYPTVQVGDYGAGFVDNPITDYCLFADKHRFIRGNHDNPAVCKEQPNWIPDGTIEGDILYVGGAGSIDRMYRTEGVDWWPDEQLDIAGLYQILDDFGRCYPEIIVSHECPEFVADAICAHRGWHKYNDDNRTRMMLQQIYHLYKDRAPKLHIFGHWHVNVDFRINGTRFICLNELSYIDIDIDDVLSGEIMSYHNAPILFYSNS